MNALIKNGKEYRADDLGCVFRWNTGYNPAQLEYAPQAVDGSYEFDNEGCLVDKSVVGEEVVSFKGREMILNDVYRIVEKELITAQVQYA